MKKEFWSDMAGLGHVGSGCAPGVYLAVTPAIAV